MSDSSLSDTIIVGLSNSIHDSSIAILQKDRHYAEALERHTQCKKSTMNASLAHSSSALTKMLAENGFEVRDGTRIRVITTWNFDRRQRLSLFLGGLRMPADLKERVSLMHTQQEFAQASSLLPNTLLLKQIFGAAGNCTKVGFDLGHPLIMWPFIDGGAKLQLTTKKISHHLAHAANAVYTSDLEECIVMIVDGSGEKFGISFFHFSRNRFTLLSTTPIGHSIGLLYSLVTRLCGFDPSLGEEWKVMGLAAYGKFVPSLHGFFRDLAIVRDLKVELRLDGTALRDLEKLAGGFRDGKDRDIMKSADLAHNFQLFFSEIVVELAKQAGSLGLSKNLAYGGGCALNSSANGSILGRSGFHRVHIPSAPGDDGNSLGAALYEKHLDGSGEARQRAMTPFLGSRITTREIQRVLSFESVEYMKFGDPDALMRATAALLAEGKIIGWVQGRAEFGARALGNRSILASPIPADMKDRINRLVKFREEYRPLAPSVLHEFGPEYFEDYQETPYMERALVFRKEVRHLVPAVVHEDGTGRLQSVRQEWNPRFHALINAFREITGVPILLNTSFNVMGKPIVHSVEDAITVLFTTGLHVLVVEDFILFKSAKDKHASGTHRFEERPAGLLKESGRN